MSPRLALALLGIFASCEWACGASTQEVQAATYVSAQQVCLARATDYDAGLACLVGIKSVFCGPGGVFTDAGATCEGGIQ